MNRAVYTRPAKPMRLEVRRREDFAPPSSQPLPEVIAVDRATECHVTPPDVAARMVGYLGGVGDIMTLEPSAGTGNLVRALLDAGQSRFEICMVERHHALASQLARLDVAGRPWQRCFLEYAEEARGKVEFPHVIMNPPFRDVRKHVAAARSLMGRGGHDRPPVLVALVPVTFTCDGMEEIEHLAPGTFPSAPSVRTKIIRIVGE